MNDFDMLLGVILFLGALFGAMRGPGRQMLGVLSFWLGMVATLWIYRLFSKEILQGFFKGSSPVIMDSFSFILLIIVFSVLIQLALVYSNKSPEEKTKKKKKSVNQMLDEANKGTGDFGKAMGGMGMGFITTSIWLSIGLAIIHAIVSINPGSGALITRMNQSMLVPYFNILLSWLYFSVKFFTPGVLPVFLTGLV